MNTLFGNSTIVKKNYAKLCDSTGQTYLFEALFEAGTQTMKESIHHEKRACNEWMKVN